MQRPGVELSVQQMQRLSAQRQAGQLGAEAAAVNTESFTARTREAETGRPSLGKEIKEDNKEREREVKLFGNWVRENEAESGM